MAGGIEVITFGCRLNSHESEILRDILGEARERGAFGARDVVVFNSCAVTSEAERQLRQSIRKIRMERGSQVLLGVVGCAAETNGATYREMPEVNFVIGAGGRLRLESYTSLGKDPHTVPDGLSSEALTFRGVQRFERRARGSVKIQDGCDNHCTFCLTRFARGRSLSAPPAEVLEQIKKLVDLGYREIVLTGVNLCDYGRGLEPPLGLGKLVEMAIREASPERLRLSSLDPAALDPDLIEQIKYEKHLMPHLHLSLQSGNSRILERMGRRHSREDVLRLAEDILGTRAEVVFGADLIAGFPGETEAMHRDSVTIIGELPIVYGHIFPYDSRPGTAAASMAAQIPRALKRERARQLREAAAANLAKLRDSLRGTEQRVFVETAGLGRLENYLQVPLGEDHSGDIGNIVTTTVL